jgi:MFS family permease
MSPGYLTCVVSIMMACRVLGMMLLLPVIPIVMMNQGNHQAIAGLAVGAYGLTQCLFAIPMGIWSDRYGRHVVIMVGLLVMIVASIIGACVHSTWALILARSLQGCGAIAGPALALLADHTSDKQRTYWMAWVGASIGGCFFIALILGPWLFQIVHLSGLFWLTTFLGILALIVLRLIPRPTSQKPSQVGWRHLLLQMRGHHLRQLLLAVLGLHALWSALFLKMAIVMKQSSLASGWPLWQWYASTMVIAGVMVLPWVRVMARRQQLAVMLSMSLVMWLLGIFGALLLQMKLQLFWLAMVLIFSAFMIFESILPSLASKWAPPASRGGMMGLYGLCQYAGAGIGAILAGLAQGFWGDGYYWLLGLCFSCLLPLVYCMFAKAKNLY